MADIEVKAPQDMRSLSLVNTSASGIKTIDNTERLYSTTQRDLEKAAAHLMMVQKPHVGCWFGREVVLAGASITKYFQIPITTYTLNANVWIAYTTELSTYAHTIAGTIEAFNGVASLGSWDIQKASGSFALNQIIQVVDVIEIGSGDNTDGSGGALGGAVEVHVVVNNTSVGGGTRSVWLYGILITPASMYSGPVPNV